MDCHNMADATRLDGYVMWQRPLDQMDWHMAEAARSDGLAYGRVHSIVVSHAEEVDCHMAEATRSDGYVTWQRPLDQMDCHMAEATRSSYHTPKR